MNRSQKEEILNCYCNSIDDCDNCELMKKYDRDTSEFTDQYACIFDEMSDDMLDKCYDWFREIRPAACENAQDSCCDKEPNVDMVNHPAHYTQGGIECIDCIKSAIVGKVGIEAFCVGNAIKYLFRYEEKNGIEDVKKARWYIDRLIKELENG